jgi:hypothetical protein
MGSSLPSMLMPLQRAPPGGFPDADGAKEGERMIAVRTECCGAGDGVGVHVGLREQRR